MNLSTFRKSFMMVTLALLTSVVMWGCGSDSYDTPQSTAVSNAALPGHATNVLIEPATLKGWMDQGLVNASSSFNGKVVILDYAGSGDLIPGAIRVESGELNAVRMDGLAKMASLVATGEQMDAVIARLGIDENTTIVFTTTAGGSFNPTRAYWTFRYWGFPQERLRVLDGGNAAWLAATYDMTSVEADVPPSNYSVKYLPKLNDNLRVSISELLATVGDDTKTNGTDYLTIDARGGAATSGYSGNGTTPSLIDSTKVVAFEGHPAGGIAIGQGDLFVGGKFKPVSDGDGDATNDLTSIFTTAGWAPGIPSITYCTSGYSCTPIFFALEAILGAEVQVFDGSWGQAGQYAAKETAADTTTGAVLPVGSAWDLTQYTANLTFNADDLVDGVLRDSKTIYALPYSPSLEADYQPGAPETNQVENEDAQYLMTPPAKAPTELEGGGGVDC